MSIDGPVALPEQGLGKEDVLERLKGFKEGDVDYKESKTWSLVYYLGEEHTRFLIEAMGLFLSENALNPMAFHSLEHDMSVFAYKSKELKVNIFAVGDQMEERGWHIDRLQRPDGLHAMVTPLHRRIVDQYINYLRSSVEHVRSKPSLALKGNAALYGAISKVPLRGVIKNEVRKMMEKMYGPDLDMPF